MIQITKPFLPPLEEYVKLVEGIWDREYLTNNGPLVQRLESELEKYLDVPNVIFLTNGTIALQIAIKALDLKGEIITTPFSYIATTSSIVWEGCKPVFVDIDPDTLNVDAAQIEAKISDKTTGILVTHVFGNPCEIEAIQRVADKYHLKIIYDAAHCFGTKYKGRSVFEFGDIITTSFHATKLYHTIEGGAVMSKNADLCSKMEYMRNFGHAGFDRYEGVGINGKNSEFHAAMGLCNLNYFDQIMERRKEQCGYYDSLFLEFEGYVRKQKINPEAEINNSYYPIIFEDEAILLKVKENLEAENIYPRRYFYPSLDTLSFFKSSVTPISRDISSRILCLPLYADLKKEDQEKIVLIIKKTLSK